MDGAYNNNDTKENSITILTGGTLVAYNGQEVFGTTKVMNYGTIEFPESQSEYIIKNTFYDYGKGLNITGKKLNLQGDINSLLYVQNDLTAKSVAISGQAQLYVNANANIDEDFYQTNQSQAWINGVLTAKSLKMDSQTVLRNGCAIKIDGDVYVTNGTNMYIMYLKAKNYKQDSGAILHLQNQSMVDITGDYKNMNNGQGSAALEEANGVAAIKAKNFYYNAPDKQGDWSEGGAKTVECSIFSTPADNAHIIIDADNIYGGEWATTPITDDNTTVVWNNGANIHWKNDADAKNYVVKASECNPNGYNDPDKNASDTNNKPSLDVISSIDYDTHDHDISATCIQPLNGRMYMSYHSRGTAHGGCVEVFSEVENNKVTLEQYLYDAQRDLDFNHLLATKLNSGDRMVYLPGSSNKKGAMLAYIPIKDNHLLADQSKSITTTIEGKDTVIYEQPLQFVQLDKAISANSKVDENCVVYNDETNHLIVMTTKGYKVYDATTWETIGTYDKPGKAKHVDIGNGKIVTLHFDRQSTDTDEELPATIEVFDQQNEDFNNPTASFSISTIKPNNGKNVVQVKDNKIYVCRGAAGIYCYDMNGQEQWHYQMPDPTYTEGNKAGTYKAYANGCWIGDKYDYVAYGSYGLVVLDKTTHEPIAHRNTPKSANYVVEHNGYIYVAYGQSRLQVFKLQNAN